MPARVIPVRVTLLAGCLAATCAGAACGDWPWRHDMVNQPSRSISSSSRAPAAGTMPVSGGTVGAREANEQELTNPIAPTVSGETGRTLYGVYCVPCHGPAGGGDGAVAKYFGQMRSLSDPEVQQHTDEWLFGTITNGTDRMPRYSHEITVAERWLIVRFVRSFSPRQVGTR